MLETAWALGFLVVLGLISAAGTVPWPELIQLGQSCMLAAAAIGIPLELAYFACFATLLARHPERPRGWYWRSFEHHHLLTPAQRLWLMPLFWSGAIAFVFITLGIGIVLLAGIIAIRSM